MVNLFVELDRGGKRTLRQQLVEQMRAAIRDQRLPPGARLPATRLLAMQLGVSRNVVIAAFEELASEGYLEGRTGSGTYVARELPPTPGHRSLAPEPHGMPYPGVSARTRAEGDGAAVIDFRDLGRPTTDRLPVAVWHALWRGVTRRRATPACAPPSPHTSHGREG
jgi:GntR family transcriptional regulator/MocR family aminotransferase